MSSISFGGTDENIQRKIRRAYDYMQSEDPESFAILKNGMATFLKGIFIALDEDLTNLATVDTGTGAIQIDTTTVSELNPVPYDEEV